MFDSPFLSDGSEPLRGTILTYVSIIIIALTLLYFVLALGWEIKVSTKKKKTRSTCNAAIVLALPPEQKFTFL